MNNPSPPKPVENECFKGDFESFWTHRNSATVPYRLRNEEQKAFMAWINGMSAGSQVIKRQTDSEISRLKARVKRVLEWYRSHRQKAKDLQSKLDIAVKALEFYKGRSCLQFFTAPDGTVIENTFCPADDALFKITGVEGGK